MVDLKDFEFFELEAFLKELGEPKFRAGQIFEWLSRGVESFDEMTNIPKSLKEKLSDKIYLMDDLHLPDFKDGIYD